MPQKSTWKAVLFDLDGTLIEFKFKVRESKAAMLDLLKKNGYDSSTMAETLRTQEIIDAASDQWEKGSRNHKMNEFALVRSELFTILDDYEFDATKRSKPHKDALSVIRKLKEAQILTGVLTNSGRLPAESILAEYGFMPYLSLLITRNDVAKMKPSPDGLELAMVKLGISGRELLYVGDSVLDIEACRAAGVKCAAVPSGFYSMDSLRKHSPDYLLDSISDLLKIVL